MPFEMLELILKGLPLKVYMVPVFLLYRTNVTSILFCKNMAFCRNNKCVFKKFVQFKYSRSSFVKTYK